jgi:hypothetical protein
MISFTRSRSLSCIAAIAVARTTNESRDIVARAF